MNKAKPANWQQSSLPRSSRVVADALVMNETVQTRFLPIPTTPNEPDAANPASAMMFQARRQRRGVAEPERCPHSFRLRHRQRARITESVSYTHLRAHETVLDLVC